MKVRLAVVALLSGAVVTACGGGSGSHPTAGQSALARVTHDFGKDYSTTTCRQYVRSLTASERSAAAGIALDRLRESSGEASPDDSQVADFAQSIRIVCKVQGPHAKIVDAAVQAFREDDPL